MEPLGGYKMIRYLHSTKLASDSISFSHNLRTVSTLAFLRLHLTTNANCLYTYYRLVWVKFVLDKSGSPGRM